MHVNFGVRAVPLFQNFDRFTVKHALQNTQNDCHQWLSSGAIFLRERNKEEGEGRNTGMGGKRGKGGDRMHQ